MRLIQYIRGLFDAGESESNDTNENGDEVTPEPTQLVAETPKEIQDREGLTDVVGIGPTRADSLERAGFHTPADLYFATDEELAEVDGLGKSVVETIRSDIGSPE